MALITKPLDLGDILDKTVKLIGKTIKRTSVVAAIILLPLTIVLAVILGNIMQDFSAMMLASAETAEAGRTLSESEARGMLTSLLSSLPLMLTGGFLFAVGLFAAQAAIIRINCHEVDGVDITWNEALRNAFGGTMWRLLAQQILFWMVLVGIYLAAILLISISPWLALLAIPGIIVAWIWCWTRWLFAPQAIVNEESSVLDSFRRSSNLVGGQFWRVLGIGILLAIISSIAISIISTPIQLFAMSGFWGNYMDMITQSGDRTNPAEQLRTLAEMFSGMGPGFGIIIGVQTILGLMVQPAYQVVMYYDACARHGDLEEIEEHENSENNFLPS
ncbi:MAG: hypothetical protein DYG96_14730 [Chlorobi bacterium CHB2]|nr:hypothetical protein [Chlorobi bacterium CHB2]